MAAACRRLVQGIRESPPAASQSGGRLTASRRLILEDMVAQMGIPVVRADQPVFARVSFFGELYLERLNDRLRLVAGRVGDLQLHLKPVAGGQRREINPGG